MTRELGKGIPGCTETLTTPAGSLSLLCDYSAIKELFFSNPGKITNQITNHYLIRHRKVQLGIKEVVMTTKKGRTLDRRNSLKTNGKKGSEDYEVNYYGDETFLKIDAFENEKNILQANISGLEWRNKALVISVIVLFILFVGTLTFSIIHQLQIGKFLEKIYELEGDQHRILTKMEAHNNHQEEELTTRLGALAKSLHNSVDTKIVLKGGDWYSEGNVFWNGKPVCDDGWNSTSKQPNVVCRSLGFETVNN